MTPKFWRDSFRAALGRRQSAYLGDHLAITETVFGRRLFVDTRDNSLAPGLMLRGVWERRISRIFRKLIRPGMHVADIGANFGWYSLLAADAVGPAGRVYSFEANPDLCKLIARTMMVNGFEHRSEIVPKAVHDYSGRLKFTVNKEFMGGSTIFDKATAEDTAAGRKIDIEIPAISLDDYFPPGARVDVIKIDTEGAEPHIFNGAKRLFRENPQMRLLIEFSSGMLDASYGAARFYEDIRTLGFKPKKIMRTGLDPFARTLKDFTEADIEGPVHLDLLLAR